MLILASMTYPTLRSNVKFQTLSKANGTYTGKRIFPPLHYALKLGCAGTESYYMKFLPFHLGRERKRECRTGLCERYMNDITSRQETPKQVHAVAALPLNPSPGQRFTPTSPQSQDPELLLMVVLLHKAK
jgi:hypothetical protein